MAAITANDIKLLASARMADTTDGGGQMTGTPLQDGAENNVFPDISSTDRAFGRLSLRKVYPAVLNTAADTLLGANVILDDLPDDPNVFAFAMPGASTLQSRASAQSLLEGATWVAAADSGMVWAGAPYAYARIKIPSGAQPIVAGAVLVTLVLNGSGVEVSRFIHLVVTSTEVLSSDGTFGTGFSGTTAGDRVFSVALDGPAVSGVLAGYSTSPRYGVPNHTVLASTRPVSGALSIGATYCDVDTLLVPVAPKHPGVSPGTASQVGIDAAGMPAGGRQAGFAAGMGLVVHHTAEVAAAAYANGNTISTRANVATVRLIGNDGGSIVTGWSVNLATGVVTVSDISGWSQPVTVRHTIEEVLGCSATSLGGALAAPNRVQFNRGLSRAFPSGSLLSSMLLLGDLQARAGEAFEQETWTGAWSDTRIGSAIVPQYQQVGNPIVVSNAGALTERWAIIFTTATTFRVVGETLGQIATGDVNTDLAPLNPATGAPYFTLQSEGWGSGWSGGNVLRFNTVGANAPIWVGRVVLPSAPSSTPDSLTVAIRGDIDA